MPVAAGRPVSDLFARTHDPEGAAWAAAAGHDWRAAWHACPRATWLMHMASLLGADLEAYTTAGLRCVALALREVDDAPAELHAAHATLVAWLEGQADDLAARRALGLASACARRLAGLQGDPPSPARDRRRAHASLARGLVRAVDDLRAQPQRGAAQGMIWPPAAGLARAAVADVRGDLARFDREASAAVRDAFTGHEPAAYQPAPPVSPPPPPLFVEVRITAGWDGLRRVWNEAAAHKTAGRLRPEARHWAALAPPGAELRLRDVLARLVHGDYALRPAVRVDDERGRLPFDPGGFPYGGTAAMRDLADLFGCPVTRDER